VLPRLIASDLDGTLIRRDGTISRRSARALSDAAAAGIAVVLVTGRPVRWMPAIYPQLDAPYTTICANGAAVYDPGADAITLERTLGADEVERAGRDIRRALPAVAFAAEVCGSRFLLHEAGYPLRAGAGASDRRVATVAEMAAARPVKLLARLAGWDPDALTEAVAAAIGPGMVATHSSSGGLVELSAPGVDKASGLAAYAASIGLSPADVLVFGDMPNDMSMFAWATSGGGRAVAVGNAHPAVRRAATATTASNDDDGVAAYLESMLGTGAGVSPAA
jgi:HAD superfamily hydrolase (TIGR01484 family)